MVSSAFCLCLAILANAAANILMKKASGVASANTVALYFNRFFISGLMLFGLNLLCYTRALKSFPLAVAYSILVGGSLAVVALVAHFGFHETITLKQLIGMVLIMVGIWCVI